MKEHQFENLLRILKLTGGKFVIVEHGEPEAILMSYEEFEDLIVPKLTKALINKAERIEEINKKITGAQMLDLREEVIGENIAPAPEEITVEPIDPI